MKTSTKNICIASGILWGLILIYLAGTVILPLVGLEYRFRVENIGRCLYILALPLWGIGVAVWKLRQRFQEKAGGRWLVRLVGGVAALLGLIWFSFGFLIIFLSTKEERYLGGGLVSVVTDSFPNSVSYTLYERVGLFFRRKIYLTPEVAADYLTDRYEREFYPVEEGWKTFYVDADREIDNITVEYISGELIDNYAQTLADYYLAKGYEELGLTWDSCFLETDDGAEHFCLILDEQKNDDAYGADVYRLMQYVLEQEPILKEHIVYICLASAEYEGLWDTMSFGRAKPWDYLSTRQYKYDDVKAAHLVTRYIDNMRLRYELDHPYIQPSSEPQGNFQSAAPTPEITPGPAPEPTVREMAEGEFPEQCEAAEAIWNAELKDAGYDYAPGFNAKGNLVIWLGKLPADNLQSSTEESDYYLTYDRESRNGNCYLFVLSEVPEGYGLNDAYLREFYACEKETLKVVAGNKTSWAQVGCEEYRELTGE